MIQAFTLACAALAAGCAPVIGFPADPMCGSPAAVRKDIAGERAIYAGTDEVAARTQARNRVVLDEMLLYECSYNSFQRRLWGDNNLVSGGGDLFVLILNGLGATTGNSATKAALAAASAGLVGAQGAISRDLYYQRTLPAVLAEMSANRDKQKAAILTALKGSDDQYPLRQADIDLAVLQRQSGIAAAIQNITETATADKTTAANTLAAVTSSPISKSSSTATVMKWLYPNGASAADPANEATLHAWMKTQSVDPALHSDAGQPPDEFFAQSQKYEADREALIRDLGLY
ncbi:MAG: hypothetical protein JO264_19400 [Acidisphaera sp.]|nr:hypothetical protein [Acidisphaera sp.]